MPVFVSQPYQFGRPPEEIGPQMGGHGRHVQRPLLRRLEGGVDVFGTCPREHPEHFAAVFVLHFKFVAPFDPMAADQELVGYPA